MSRPSLSLRLCGRERVLPTRDRVALTSDRPMARGVRQFGCEDARLCPGAVGSWCSCHRMMRRSTVGTSRTPKLMIGVHPATPPGCADLSATSQTEPAESYALLPAETNHRGPEPPGKDKTHADRHVARNLRSPWNHNLIRSTVRVLSSRQANVHSGSVRRRASEPPLAARDTVRYGPARTGRLAGEHHESCVYSRILGYGCGVSRTTVSTVLPPDSTRDAGSTRPA